MRIPDPKANTTTEAYLAYKAGYLEESELKPVLYEPYLHFDAWLAYWAGLTNEYPLDKNGDPEMITDEEAIVAYLSGVTDTYPEEIKDPYDVRIVGYLKHLASVRWPEPDYPVNNEEFYLSTMEPTHTSNSEPSSDIELDTAEGKIISVEAYGDTYQQTYSGKNLLRNSYHTETINDVTFTSNADGTITVNGTASENTNYYIGSSTPYLLPEGTYTLSTGGIVSSDTTYFVFGDGVGTVYWDSRVGQRMTQTVPAGGINVNFRIVVRSGVTLDNVVFKLQLEAGSTATSFEPYVGGIPAPNPDYPQDIQVVTGEQTVEVCGKNLFDIRNATGTRGNNTVVASGQTIVVNSNTNGTETAFYLNECSYISQYAPSSYTNARDYNMTGMGGDYTLKVYYQNIPSGTGALNTSIYTNKQQILKNRASIVGGVIEVAISLDADEYIKSIILYTSNTNVFSNFTIKAQLEQGSPTTYGPYTSQSYPLSLGSIELCKIGNYQDYIYKSGGDWYVHKETGKTILDSVTSMTLNNGQSNTDTLLFQSIALDDAGSMERLNRNTLISDHFNTYNNYAASQTAQGICTHYSTAMIRMPRSYLATEDIAGMQAWLSSNPTIVYYALATPTDTKITDSTLMGQLDALAGANTYDEKTYIKVTANDPNLPALLKVEAYKY